jgi:hypothetical protein
MKNEATIRQIATQTLPNSSFNIMLSEIDTLRTCINEAHRLLEEEAPGMAKNELRPYTTNKPDSAMHGGGSGVPERQGIEVPANAIECPKCGDWDYIHGCPACSPASGEVKL